MGGYTRYAVIVPVFHGGRISRIGKVMWAESWVLSPGLCCIDGRRSKGSI